MSRKACSSCKVEKALEDFYKHKASFDGRTAQCAACCKIAMKARYQDNPEKYKARAKKYYAENKTNCDDRSRAWSKLAGWPQTLISDARKRARKQSLDFDLDVDWLRALFERQNGLCFWYHIGLEPADVYRNPLQPSIDRIDCAKGYIKSNVVLACAAANLGRNATPPDEFSLFASKLAMNFRGEGV